jgi:hypothetical protein
MHIYFWRAGLDLSHLSNKCHFPDATKNQIRKKVIAYEEKNDDLSNYFQLNSCFSLQFPHCFPLLPVIVHCFAIWTNTSLQHILLTHETTTKLAISTTEDTLRICVWFGNSRSTNPKANTQTRRSCFPYVNARIRFALVFTINDHISCVGAHCIHLFEVQMFTATCTNWHKQTVGYMYVFRFIVKYMFFERGHAVA